MTNAELLSELFDGMPHFKPPNPERTFRVYMKALDGVKTEAVEYAVYRVLRENRRFMPTPGELYQMAQNFTPESPVDPVGRFWYRMGELSKVLRGERGAVVELPEGVPTEWDELDPDELQRQADEKAGYTEAEPF